MDLLLSAVCGGNNGLPHHSRFLTSHNRIHSLYLGNPRQQSETQPPNRNDHLVSSESDHGGMVTRVLSGIMEWRVVGVVAGADVLGVYSNELVGVDEAMTRKRMFDIPYKCRYRASHVRNDPRPIQPHLPICVGGGGEKVTLKLVAKYADMNNVGGGIDSVRRKEAVLLEHCASVGRDPSEIERTTGIGVVVIRDDRTEAERVFRAAFERNRVARPWEDQPVGTPEDVAAMLAPYVALGYRHLVAGFPADYDEESMTRFATEVKPMLEKLA